MLANNILIPSSIIIIVFILSLIAINNHSRNDIIYSTITYIAFININLNFLVNTDVLSYFKYSSSSWTIHELINSSVLCSNIQH